jgi:hypothetical protein
VADPDGPGVWPTAATTGVPPGTTLKPSGDLTITQDGAVVDGLLVDGTITVHANNVTIKNTKIVHGVIDNGNRTQTGTLIQDVEIDGTGPDYIYAAISSSGFTAVRVNIHGVGAGFHATDDVVVRDSYVHDLLVQGDPANGGTHNEAFLSNGGHRIVVTNNRLTAGTEANFSSALSLYGDFDPVDDVLVENNLLNGGGYCVYAGSVESKAHPVATNSRFIGNTFGQDTSPTCGGYGPVTSYDPSGGNAWTNNTWIGGGTVDP